MGEVGVAVGWCILQCEVGGGVWAKKPKPSHGGSVSGTLCKLGVRVMQRSGGHG